MTLGYLFSCEYQFYLSLSENLEYLSLVSHYDYLAYTGAIGGLIPLFISNLPMDSHLKFRIIANQFLPSFQSHMLQTLTIPAAIVLST